MSFDLLFTEYQHFTSVEEIKNDLLINSYSEHIYSLEPKPIKVYRNYCLRCVDIISHQKKIYCKPTRQGHDFLKNGFYLEFSIGDTRHIITCRRVDIESMNEFCKNENGERISVEDMIRLNNRGVPPPPPIS